MNNKNLLLFVFLLFLILNLLISCNKVNSTQLLKAVMDGNYEVVEKYIKQGGDINYDYEKVYSYTEDEWPGIELLTITIVKKHRDIFKLLIDAGINVNKKSKGDYTPIMTAVNNEDIQFVKDLIDAGADLNEVNDVGNTALIISCLHGYYKMAKLLVSAGADINKQNNEGYTPLLIAIGQGYNNIAELLLNNNCNPNITDIDGLSPLILAVYNEDIKLIKLLLSFKADVNHQINESKASVMHLAVQKQNIEIVQILLEAGANPNIKNNKGLTPKDIAISNKLTDIVQLIEKYEDNFPPQRLPVPLQ